MARSKVDHGFVALKIEGGLFSGQFLQKAAALQGKRQSAADYGLPKGLNIKEEIGRAWRIALAEWRDYQEKRQRQDIDACQVGVEGWLQRLLQSVLGFSDLKHCKPRYIAARRFPLSHFAGDGHVPMLLATHGVDLDRGQPAFGDEGRRRSAHALVQEFLNADDDCLWGVVSNGNRIRLLRDNPSLTRPAYLEADLERMFEEELYPDFAAFWLLFHASRFQPADHTPETCALEEWRHEAEEVGVRALSHLRDGVTQALRELGSGFLAHPANSELRQQISAGELRPETLHAQLLRLVYRFIFLLTAEDREILFHPQASAEASTIYREGYALGLLRERSLKRHFYDQHGDLWQGLQVVFRALAAGAEPLGLPALGGLFDAEQCPVLDGSSLSNQALLKAVHALCFFRSGDTLARVNYRDMGVEELGSVYESLLELHPQLDIEARPWRFAFAGDDTEGSAGKGSERKLTGSYYTPPSLVNVLIKSALEPVIEQTLATDPENPRHALLKLKIIDPACGSGHFLLAAARRLAAELARIEAQTDQPDEMLYRHTLREVVQHCIFGVDRNPMAVELCKTALWLETIEPGKPLGFLDHHIHCGDSLVGVRDPQILRDGIPDEAYKPLTGDNKDLCKMLRKNNPDIGNAVQGGLFDGESLEVYQDVPLHLDDLPEETLADVRAKREAWRKAQDENQERRKKRLQAHLFVAAFFAPKTNEFADAVPTNLDLNRIRRNMPPREKAEALAWRLAEEQRFFHWHLAFPDVFADGGFDVVMGNPPWEVSQLSEEEYFAIHAPSIAALPGAKRKRAIAELEISSPLLWSRYLQEKHQTEANNTFIRESMQFELTAKGKLNLYALFAEAFLSLLNKKGRAGIIVPTGIATDDSTKAYFEAISIGRRLVSLYDFENRQKLFPAVDSRMKFSLLTLGNDVAATDFAFFLTDTLQLKDKRRHFTLSGDDIRQLNPNTRTCPVFRSQADAELTKNIYRNASVLIDESKGEAGNPWGISFRQGLFNMTSDSALFRTYAQLIELGARLDRNIFVESDGRRWLPLYEAKMVNFYDHRAGSYESRGSDRGYRVLPPTPLSDYQNPNHEVMPFYWVPEEEVRCRTNEKWDRNWLLSFKDVTASTNERTVIQTIIPFWGVGHTAPIIFPDTSTKKVAFLLSNLCSFVLDFAARQKVGGLHLTFSYFKQFPILPVSTISEETSNYIIPRILELTYTSESLRPWAEDLGYQGAPFPWNPERRALLRAELDAYYAKLYGLTRDELRYILDPADVYGEDYPSETFRVLKEKEIRQYGEYRTRRLVLEAWDRLFGGNV
ncbi:Eco57I restriction-modification methylase domain-containing protein [Geobacter sp.]|uniref:Eco57I restriction-modification methylase domain-containing protein n=1 Tax=Geobacter sp. TaxID=46610 RepID=UPI0027BAE733|nr:N-6 DNA methylase [Geobacter sp.]